MKRVEDFLIELGVAVEDAEKKLFEIRPNDGKYFKKNGTRGQVMCPLYFSVVSLLIKDAVSVLEIGVNYGRTANLLSHLFSKATIYEVDFPLEQIKPGVREEEFDRNMGKDNIKFIEKNSFFLPSMGLPREFDLIYVDGGHKYPIVAWDIMFAYNSIRSGGFVFFDNYDRTEPDVKLAIDHIRGIISEEIKTLPIITPPNHQIVAWLRKLGGEKIR